LLVGGHHQHVVEVELLARVHQDGDDVSQIVQLVLGKELVMKVEGAEDHVDDGYVVLVAAVERVVTDGDIYQRRCAGYSANWDSTEVYIYSDLSMLSTEDPDRVRRFLNDVKGLPTVKTNRIGE
jgi:hypothetical protein